MSIYFYFIIMNRAIVTYANKNKAYIITEESDFIVQKNAYGVISPKDIFRSKKSANKIEFYSINNNTAMRALGFDNEQELYTMIYMLGNMYEHLDEEILKNLKKKYHSFLKYDNNYLNICDCIKIVKELNKEEGEWSKRLIGDMEISDELKEKINQDV